ncbi:MAG: two-component hybrid sensor and regulator [Acidobacteria bacterium]|jgi:signal transduction histidine kinase|nr:two-component hybrid sensor and regulator [Acidobacteriota bacterium]
MSDPIENFNKEKDSQIFNLSYLVLAVLILLTVGVTYNFFKSAKSKDTIRFSNHISLLESSIESKINLYVALLKGSKGFIETAPELTHGKFSEYVSYLNLQNHDSGVQGMGFAQTVKTQDYEALNKRMNADGFSDFKIYPPNETGSGQIVVYIEPFEDHNKKIIGFDMTTQPHYREAMRRAEETGEAAASSKVVFAGDGKSGGQEGFVIFLPVYKKSEISASSRQFKGDLLGFVFIALKANNFFNDVYETIPEQDIRFKVFDGEVSEQNLLAYKESNNSVPLNFANITEEKHEAQNSIEIIGRKWILQYNTLPIFTEQSSVGWTPLILLCGFAFSFLLFGMTYWEAASRAKAQKTAGELLEMQKQREILLENERQARQIAEEANTSKDEFISIISHELKTPLNAIAGWARILRTHELSRGTKELALQKIDKNLRSQARLVEQLLNYSEIISGKSVLKVEDVDFSELFEETISQIEPLAKEKNITLSKFNQLDHHLIYGDKEKIKIVIQNLLTNAVKFTQSGGKIETSVSELNGDVQMIVKDDGRGISREFLPYVFERYKQADNPNIRDYGGLGLGLTISKHIVNLHRGKISADSDGKGKGSTFMVKFPVRRSV